MGNYGNDPPNKRVCFIRRKTHDENMNCNGKTKSSVAHFGRTSQPWSNQNLIRGTKTSAQNAMEIGKTEPKKEDNSNIYLFSNVLALKSLNSVLACVPNITGCLLLFAIGMLLLASSGVSGQGFVHPGLLHTQNDFNRMAQMVAQNASPWIEDWNKLITSGYMNLNWQPHPSALLIRGATSCGPDNSVTFMNDVAAAYQMALVWKITGNSSYANTVIKILNAWSYTVTQIGCPQGPSWDWVLMAGTQGYQIANVGEIMRNYSGWNQTDFQQFKSMMINLFYPINAGLYTMSLGQYSNWGLGSMASIMAIGVLCDNQTLWNQSISFFKTGFNNGAISFAVYFIHPGNLGQGQEAGRDQGHNTLDAAHLSVIAQMAWNQGVDLYGYGNNRILTFSEFTTKANLQIPGSNTYYTVPWTTYQFLSWPNWLEHTVFAGPGNVGRPTWACFYHHYVNIKGLAAPFTGAAMNLIAPDGGQGGCCSYDFDQLGFQTLTCSLPPIAQGVAPQFLRGYVVGGSVQLNWFGSAYSSSYNVKRSSVPGGPYTTVANVDNMTFTYTDSGLGAGTYYYVVTVLNNTVEILTSNQAEVVFDTRQLQTYFKFDGILGTNVTTNFTVVDSSGSGNNAVLVGNATIVPGLQGQALQLDGVSAYINLTLNTINISDFTIATWLYINKQNNFARLFDFGYGKNRYMYFAPYYQGRLNNAAYVNGYGQYAITYNTYSGEFQNTLPFGIVSGQWVHVAITYYGTQSTVYVNGFNVSSCTIPLNPYLLQGASDIPAQFTIGLSQDPTNPLLAATLDEFRIYYVALTSDQVYSLANNIVTWLKFNSLNTTTPDSSPSGNNGTIHGGVTSAPGIVNGAAASFNGANGYISLPRGFMSNITSFTVAAWVYAYSVANWARVFDFGSSTSTYMFLTIKSSQTGNPRYNILLNGVSQLVDATVPFPVGQWTHMAVTFNGTVATYYQNGSFAGSSNVTITPSQLGNTTNNWIGHSQYSADPYLDGLVSDFRVHQEALPIGGILALAQQANFIYNFDESSGNTTADASGNNLNGSLVNNATFVPGFRNNALKLNGINSYVNAPASILNNVSDFTVATWVYLNNTANWSRVFDFGFGTGKWMMFTPTSGSAVSAFEIYNGGSQYNLLGTAPLPSNRWVHVAIVKQGNNGTVYLNGQAATTGYVSIPPYTLNASGLTAQNCIGHSQNPTDPYLNGMVDDFKFYYYALTQSQVAVLAQQLELYLQFDESSGNKVSFDSSGNGNHASLIGNATFVPGRINNAIKLDGNTGHVNLSSNILVGLADFSVTAWVYLNAQQTSARVFDFGFGTGQYMHFTPRNSNGYAEFALVLGSVAQYVTAGTPVPIGQWAHVAITRLGSVGTYYLNGQAVATGNISLSPLQLLSNTTNLTAQIWLGHSQFSADPLLNGFIDDFRVYRGALAYDQVASLAQNLITYLRFDETTNATNTTSDSSGYNDYGTLTGNVTFVQGLINNAISLNGNGSYVTLANQYLTSNLSDFTVSAWVYLNTITNWVRLFDFGFGTKEYMYFTVADANHYGDAAYVIVTANGVFSNLGPAPIPTGEWVHIAVVQQANNASYYVNGQLAASAIIWEIPLQIYRSDIAATNYIGHSQYPTDPYLNGSIDDFRIYQGALSSTQISSLAQSLSTYLPFSESGGVVTADATGNGFIGQLHGGASFVAGRPGENAIKLDGVSGYVSLPTGVVSSLKDFTITTWVYLSSAAMWARVFDFGSSTSTYMFFTVESSLGFPRFNFLLNGVSQLIDGSVPFPVGQWVHVTVTLSGTVGTFYINGHIGGTNGNFTITPLQLGATTNNWIGHSQYSADPYLNGIVDDFTIYNRALTATEVLYLAQPFLLNYQFNETTGNVVYDSSGNGNNGTLCGNATIVSGLTGDAAVQLNGVNSYVAINNSNLLENLSDFSITFWAYVNTIATWARLFDFGFGQAQWMMYTVRSPASVATFTIQNTSSGAAYSVYGASAFPTGQWLHVAVTLEGTNCILYLNGSVFGHGVMPLAPYQIYNASLNATNYIGHSQYPRDPYLNGTIDNFQVYYGALSQTEIANLIAYGLD